MSKPGGGAILCVGYNEDTAYFTLKEKGYAVDAIDPEFDTDLDGFFRQHHGKRYYNCIFSTSVIEHVADDETFISQIAQLLAPGGVAILTMDFREDYQNGVLIPAADERFYTSDRLLGAFVPLLHGCTLLDIPDWNEHEPDFDYEGCRYGFATLVFRKNAALPDSVTANYERQTVRLLENIDRWQQRELVSKYTLAMQQAKAIAERDMARRERDINAQERDRILHSLSWRVTKPLRFAKLCLRNPHDASRKFKEKVKMLSDAYRLILKKGLFCMGQYVLARPQLKAFCMRILDHFPQLRNRLAVIIHDYGNARNNLFPASQYKQLSPLGREVYAMLTAHQTKGNTCHADRH